MKVLFSICLVLLIATSAYAVVAVQDDGTIEGDAVYIDFVDSTVTFSGDTATVDTSVMATATITAATITSLNALGNDFTVSGTDLYYAGNKVTN